MSRSRVVHVQEMEQPPRVHPDSMTEVTTSRFLVRTSNFLKKVSHLTNGRKKTNDANSSSTQEAATFAARSMALGRKSFGFSQPILGVQTNNMPHHRRMSEHGDSSEGCSTSSPRSSDGAHRSNLTRNAASQSKSPNGSANTSTSTGSHPNPSISLTSSAHTRPVPDGLPHNSNESPWLPSPPPGDPPPARATSPQPTLGNLLTLPQDMLQSPPSRSSSLPPSGSNSPSAAPGESSSSTPQMRFARTPELSRAQSLHIRLASLPPPMMARYTTQGSARLTPSIVPRQPPMPIQNLPTLPPPTPVLNPAVPSRAHVRSIPALPLNGPRDDDNPDMDDDGSDSSEDGMEEDMGARDDMSEEDEGEDSPGLPPGPIMSRRREALPTVDTSPLNLSFSFASFLSNPSTQSSGSEAAQQQRGPQRSGSQPLLPSADIIRTPQPGLRDGHIDYFTSKTRQADNGIEEVSRTPRPTDYTPAVPLVVGLPNTVTSTTTNGSSGPGMIPRIVPMPPTPISPALSHRTPRFAHSPAPPGAELTSRPSLYHHGSRSMVDLMSYQRSEKEKEDARDQRSSHTLRPPTGDGPSHSGPPDAAPAPAPAPTLRRQRSLPTYRPASLPPPYPQFFPGRSDVIQPREEEGREDLPSYTNSIYLCTMMPRKLEFTAPGVQAKERKWRRVVVELEGTILRVYRCHAAGTTGKVGEWWERTVGVGDWSSGLGSSAPSAAGGARVSGVTSSSRDRRTAGVNDAGGGGGETVASERVGKGEEDDVAVESEQSTSPRPKPQHQHSASKSKLHLVASSLLHPTRSSQDSSSSSRLTVPSSPPTRSRLSFDTSRESERSPSALGVGRRSVDVLQRRGSITRSMNSDIGASPSTSPTARSVTSPSTISSSPTTSTSASSRRSRSRGPSTSHSSVKSAESSQTSTTMVLESKDVIKSYTLQNAESGLASDYVKRRNVIRVRMEGEQFLLQARDVAGVIDWIEGIQAATNVALDLDERPMPKGPMFPRRRRRRQRRPDGTLAPSTQEREPGTLRANAPVPN